MGTLVTNGCCGHGKNSEKRLGVGLSTLWCCGPQPQNGAISGGFGAWLGYLHGPMVVRGLDGKRRMSSVQLCLSGCLPALALCS